MNSLLQAGQRACVRTVRKAISYQFISATGPVTGVVIRGADGMWQSADVAIDGETLLVSSAAVHDPVEIR